MPISTASSRSTMPSATPRATMCWPRCEPAAPARCATSTSSRGSAATNSSSPSPDVAERETEALCQALLRRDHRADELGGCARSMSGCRWASPWRRATPRDAGPDPLRRPRSLPGQERRSRHLPLLRPGDERARAPSPHAGDGPAPRRRRRANSCCTTSRATAPARCGCSASRRWCAGTTRTRPRQPGGVHPARRGDRA